MNKNLLSNIIHKTLLTLPTPINISYWWNIGSLLGLFVIIQILRGIFISIHYCPNTLIAFSIIIHIIQNVNNGWLIHNIHINGASIFFLFIYIHIARNLYYNSFILKLPWIIGVTILLYSIIIAFLGYVLPWGQISYWGATVITNLISTIPYAGKSIIIWLWGGFSINNATLNRFYSFHFIMPFTLIILIIFHLIALHLSGSKNPLGTPSNIYKIPFNIYFTLKDILGFLIFTFIFIYINLQYSYHLRDPDNFSIATPLITPTHIQPEWYFLFAYAILRSVPSKLGGVIALIISILILYFLPLITPKINTLIFYPINQIFFWLFINLFIILTWLGGQLIEYPFIQLSQLSSIFYFLYFITFNIFSLNWDKIIFN